MIDDRLKEACGVFGIYSNKPYAIAYDVQLALFALQHRGEESAGLAIASEDGIINYRNMGTVPQVLSDRILKDMPKSHIAIGHTRYSTTGSSNAINAQPIVYSGRAGEIALGHNGNIFNSEKIRDRLIEERVLFQTAIDSEAVGALINYYYKGDLAEAIISASRELRGSYAIVMMTKDTLIAVRDPSGIRPLVMGRLSSGGVVFASETPALDVIGAEFIRDVLPGEIILVKDSIRSYHIGGEHKEGVCSFEYVYFARTDSIMDGLPVFEARKRAGELLAKNHGIDADIVAPVPDSAAVAASAYSTYAKIPYEEVLSKNRYVGRTFIQPEQNTRENMVKVKLSAIKGNVLGKRIILIDDSIVRGTTCKKIIQMLKDAGAKEIHLRITSPPVKFPCYFGIDIQTKTELAAYGRNDREIADLLGADSVEYLSVEELKSMCAGRLQICTGCFSNDYPVEVNDDKIDKLRME